MGAGAFGELRTTEGEGQKSGDKEHDSLPTQPRTTETQHAAINFRVPAFAVLKSSFIADWGMTLGMTLDAATSALTIPVTERSNGTCSAKSI